jgi:hypothetical protein
VCALGKLLPLLCERPEPVNDLDGEQRRQVLAQADVAVDKRAAAAVSSAGSSLTE